MSSQPAPPGATAPRIEAFALGPFETNCYLVYGPAAPGRCWFADCGRDPAPMLDRADELSLAPEAIVLTHAHHDHIEGLPHARERFPDLPVWIHEAERDWLADADLNLSRQASEMMPAISPFTTAPPDDLLRDGQRLSLAGLEWLVVHTPGHSPGGITLVHPAGPSQGPPGERAGAATVALVGDTLFSGSVGRTDFPTSDHDALIRSIAQRLYALPDSTRVLPGHGPATTIGREKMSNPFVRPGAGAET